MRRIVAIVCAGAVFAGAALVCLFGGFLSDSPSAVVVTVLLTRQGFSPAEVALKKGESIRFVSGVSRDCDLSLASCFIWPASDPHPSHEFYPEFDPREPIGPGESWTFEFNRVGNWGYHDHFKSSSRGTVRVTE